MYTCKSNTLQKGEREIEGGGEGKGGRGGGVL